MKVVALSFLELRGFTQLQTETHWKKVLKRPQKPGGKRCQVHKRTHAKEPDVVVQSEQETVCLETSRRNCFCSEQTEQVSMDVLFCNHQSEFTTANTDFTVTFKLTLRR